MTAAADKAEARRIAFARRKGAHARGLDAAAQAHLRAALEPWRGRVLAGYLPIRTEIDPRPVMADWAGAVCVPVIKGTGQPLDFLSWEPGCAMVTAEFGVDIPRDGRLLVPEVLIVPMVAFDPAGFRLGYGGGFYDRTLERLRAAGEVIAIGFAYGAQELEELPQESTDQPLDMLVTEAGMRAFRRD